MKSQIYFPLFFIIILQSCASLEEGEVDYVRTISDNAIDAKTQANCSSTMYDNSQYVRSGITRGCYETLYRKYTKVPEIKKDETISVHLMQAFNGFAVEGKSFTERLSGSGSNAEIVVIANVCEQGISGCSLRFGPESDKGGRVIYYSNAVKAKQYLNFSYLPVYGPIKYQGGPLIIQISILELDDLSDQQKNLLSTLADAGKKAYPPASTALNVLDKVGSSLLAGSQDDVIFRYTMSLVPATSKYNYHSPIIAEGNYAFIRKNTTKDDIKEELTSKLMFDQLTGRLVQECGDIDKHSNNKQGGFDTQHSRVVNPCTLNLNNGKKFKDYRENTYLTFQIKSGFAESTLDNMQTFESLLNEINTEKDEGALEAIEAISELKEEVTRSSEQKKLYKLLVNIENVLSDNTKGALGLFKNEIFKFQDEYDSQIGNYKSLTCSTPTNPKCKLVISANQLSEVQSKARAILNEINPTASESTVIPSGFETLHSTFGTEFEKGYRQYSSDYLAHSFLSQLNSIKTLSDHITSLKNNNTQEENVGVIESRQSLLKSELQYFLNSLSKNLTVKKALNCSDINVDKCYQYLTDSQTTELITIFNVFAETMGMDAADKLTVTANSVSNNFKIIDSLKVLK